MATAIATAQPGTTSATAVQAGSIEVTQQAEQTQSGGEAQTQMIEQSTVAGDDVLTILGTTAFDPRAGGWTLAQGIAAQQLQRWAAGGGSPTTPARRPAERRRDAAPRIPQAPLPSQAPAALGAAPGGTSGVSLWVFAALLIPFLLAAPWWARRHGPSVVRRLTGVVSRLERPG